MKEEEKICQLRELLENLLSILGRCRMLFELENLDNLGEKKMRNQMIDEINEIEEMAKEIFVPEIINPKGERGDKNA